MANLKEQEKWEDGVYQIEENDPVLGGENGITNKPIRQLANRTLWLKKFLELFGKKSAPKDLTAESTSSADESGHSHKLPHGSTSQKGIWQATSDTGVDSENLVLTAKAGKKLAQLIATVQTALNNYIPLKSRSSSVTSNDENGVATSKAVKTAYDKGVEAKNAADNANNNANNRVAKSGDTMTGILTLSGKNKGGFSPGLCLKNTASGVGSSAFVDFIQSDTNAPRSSLWFRDTGDGGSDAQILTSPPGSNINQDKRQLHTRFFPNGDLWVKNYGYLHDFFIRKSGDVMTGDLTVPYLRVSRDHSWMNIISKAHSSSGLDFSVLNDKFAQSSIQCQDIGGYSSELRFFNTPPGANYSTDRRQHVMSIGHSGNIWAKPYGWIDQFFAKQAWANRFKQAFYNAHYNGAEVYKIPMRNEGGLMITTMNVLANGTQTFNLPENYTGWAIPMAVDVGNGRHSIGISMEGGNKVTIYNSGQTGCQIIVIGWSTF